jgi:hypothetical protein
MTRLIYSMLMSLVGHMADERRVGTGVLVLRYAVRG